MDVAIDDGGLLPNLTTELQYRLALTMNTLVQTTADSAVAVDAAVNVFLTSGSFVTANTIRSVSQSLAGINARAFNSDGTYGGIIHPTVVRDILNDTTNNGLTDILKRSESGAQKLYAPLSNQDVIEFAGVRFKQTTTCPTTVISTKTNYQTYIFAEDSIFSIALGAASDLGGADGQSFKLMVQEAPSNGSVSDPARQIGGWCSYNQRFTSCLRPGSTMTIRRIQAETAAS